MIGSCLVTLRCPYNKKQNIGFELRARYICPVYFVQPCPVLFQVNVYSCWNIWPLPFFLFIPADTGSPVMSNENIQSVPTAERLILSSSSLFKPSVSPFLLPSWNSCSLCIIGICMAVIRCRDAAALSNSLCVIGCAYKALNFIISDCIL